MAIRCYVINLAEREDRRSLIGERLGAEGLVPVFFAAHDGSGCEAAEGFSLKKGERGCFASHRELLRLISASDDQVVHLVLEDDAVFAKGFKQKLKRAVESLPKDWGYFQAGWLPTSMEKKLFYRLGHRMAALPWAHGFMRRFGMRIGSEPSIAISEVPAWGTHCYAIRPWFARKMMACLETAPFAPIDKYFRFVWDADSRGMYKARFPLSGQDWLVGSDVDPERFRWAEVQVDPDGKMIRPGKRI